MRLPQLGGPDPCIYILREQGGPVIPMGNGCPFVASYNLQDYGGGILTRLHTVLQLPRQSRVTLRLTVGQLVCLGADPTLG
jgi:hypothetical protein